MRLVGIVVFALAGIGGGSGYEPRPPRTQAAEWKLVLERTISPPVGSAGELAQPYDLGVTGKGQITVLDRVTPGVLIFAPDGRLERVLGARGAGPGEFSVFALMDVRGDTVVVYDDGRLILWRADGSNLKQWRTPTCTCGEGPLIDRQGDIWTPVAVRVLGAPRQAMVRWSAATITRDTIILPVIDSDHAWLRFKNGGMHRLPFGAMRQGTFDSRMRYVQGSGVTNELVVTSWNSDTLRRVVLNGERAAIVSRLRDSAYKQLMQNPDAALVLKTSDIATHQPAFLRLHADEADNVWVERPNGRGEVDRYDVVNPDGKVIATVKSPTEPALRNTRIVIRQGRLYRLAESPDGEPVIQVYRVIRTGI